MKRLTPSDKLDIQEVLQDLDAYRPRRKGWTWRQLVANQKVGPFRFQNTSKPLTCSVPLPSAHDLGNIDPQCDMVLTTEIASGRFEDDIRRMRMAAWHGADHIMVIRTMGQSHIDGLLEGTPEGVGGIPITRKQVRATRKALDAIEDEVGHPINFHSYVSGVAGPEIAVMFAEEGVNGAHQDPQYNILYRNINIHRSIVDAAEAKVVMASAGILQIDGAHNGPAGAYEQLCAAAHSTLGFYAKTPGNKSPVVGVKPGWGLCIELIELSRSGYVLCLEPIDFLDPDWRGSQLRRRH